MNKQISCCVPWAEFADFPLARKLIKEKLSKCMSEITVVVSTFPECVGFTQKDATDFHNWLADDLAGYATVQSIGTHQIPSHTKWSGNWASGTYMHGYGYPFEYCIDRCTTPYIARIETDFITNDWDKIEKIMDYDFDLITNGCYRRELVDISCIIAKKDFFTQLPDLTFMETSKRTIAFAPQYNHYVDDQDYSVFNKNWLTTSDTIRQYDQLQWALMQCLEQSDKVYVINQHRVHFHHFLGLNIRYFSHLRGGTLAKIADREADPFLYYIDTMKQQIDINNYNLYPVYHKIMQNYDAVYGGM